MSFKDKVVLITGGSAGIGATTAETFAKEEATVVIVGRNQENLNKVKKNCEELNATVLAIKADVTNDDEAKEAIKETISKFGKLDVLVNNAGIYRKTGILDDNFMDTFDQTLNTNMRAVALLTHIAAPHLIKTKGNIVNISSIAGEYVGMADLSAYKVSKAALTHFTKCTALELATYGVRVNAVSPGPVPTDICATGGVLDNFDTFKATSPLGKIASTQDIADMIIFLVSDKANSVTGTNVIVDNGRLLRY